MATHLLQPEPHTVVGFFDPERPPVLSVNPGDIVRCQTLDAGWLEPEQVQFEDQAALAKWPHRAEGHPGHALLGPIEVRGARAGQVLEVQIRQVQVGTWGWGGAGSKFLPDYYAKLGHAQLEPFPLVWRLDAEAGIGTSQHGDRIRLRPFPGVLGMPPPEPGQHSTFPPRRWGGNLDCRELVTGTTLWLPIPVDGAMLHVGDGHATQGDGEVSGVAIECPLSQLELRIDVHDGPLGTPRFLTAEGIRGTLAVAQSIDDAWVHALDAMVDWVAADTGRAPGHVLALASVFADLRITQTVNGTVGVHCLWRSDRQP